ncbi:hypothetical protein HOD61_02630 [archaeon]|jgi:hypothetical protein|nr:hypothetical protein [archaeon]
MEGINLVLLTILGILGIAAIYVYFSYTLMIIGKKTKTGEKWMAWIPFVQYYYICKIGKKPTWWMSFFIIPPVINNISNYISLNSIVLSLITIISTVYVVMIWMNIAERRKMSKWLGLMELVPIANLVMMGILAYSKK